MKPKGNPDRPSNALDKAQLRRISETTIGHYDRTAEDYWDGTRNHDVSQNYEALLEAIEGDPAYAILDLGCGPGRDLRYFRSLGHDAMGLDGSMKFVAMARRYSGCDVLHQNFLAMNLPVNRFDGIFANASLFHVPCAFRLFHPLQRQRPIAITARTRGRGYCRPPLVQNPRISAADRIKRRDRTSPSFPAHRI